MTHPTMRNLYRTDGTIRRVVIQSPIKDLSVIAELLNCHTVAYINTPSASFLVDEDGVPKQLPLNPEVSDILRRPIVGDALELQTGDMA